ncbi:MAG: hypothetical protein ACYC09_11215 [Bacteroidota bacterium]
MEDITSLEGPLELIDGQLVLRIPLSVGGDKLASVAQRISRVDSEYLNVTIQPWLAEKLRISEGSLVVVDNKNGKFNIARSSTNDK